MFGLIRHAFAYFHFLEPGFLLDGLVWYFSKEKYQTQISKHLSLYVAEFFSKFQNPKPSIKCGVLNHKGLHQPNDAAKAARGLENLSINSFLRFIVNSKTKFEVINTGSLIATYSIILGNPKLYCDQNL